MKNNFYSRLMQRICLILLCSCTHLYTTEPPSEIPQSSPITLQWMITKVLEKFGTNKFNMPPLNAKVPLAHGRMDFELSAGGPVHPFSSASEYADEFSQWNPGGSIGKLLQSNVDDIPCILTHRIQAFRQDTWNVMKPYVYLGCFIMLAYMTYQVWSSHQKRKLKKEKLNLQKWQLNATLKNTEKMQELVTAMKQYQGLHLKRSNSVPIMTTLSPSRKDS